MRKITVLWLSSKREMPKELRMKLEKQYYPAEIVVKKVTAREMVTAAPDFPSDYFLW